jgi:prolycopene isomerase
VGLDDYLDRVKARFPHQAENLDLFFAAVRDEYLYGLLHHFRGRQPTRPSPGEELTLRQALDRYFDDPKIKLLLTADCPHWGSPPGRTSFTFDSMLRLSYFLGNYYPAGGSQAFVDDLARCLERHGGDILMSTRVERIRVEGDRVAGVDVETLRGKLRGARTIDAEVVVSNADLRQTVHRLVGATQFPERYLERLDRLRPTFPCFLTHLGLRDVPTELLQRIQGYYWNTWDAERVGLDALRCKVFVPTLYAPELAPEGGSQLNIGVRTVETHRERIMRKLDIHSVAGLTKFAIANGMVSLGPDPLK